MTVGASTQASEFLTSETIRIFLLGFMAFVIASASGVLFVKLFNLFLPKSKKINPLIGNAGVSAVPMSARISNNLGLEYDPSNYLLMHAMGERCRCHRFRSCRRCAPRLPRVVPGHNKAAHLPKRRGIIDINTQISSLIMPLRFPLSDTQLAPIPTL